MNAQSDLKHLYIHPSHFSSTIDTKAKRTANNIGNIYGTSEKDREYLRVGESNYKNNLFTGHRTDFDSTVRSAGKSGIDHSDYVNKFMGIPKNVKILNNDNTLYYEKKLANKTEFDYAIDNMTTDLDKQAGLQHLIHTIRNKKSTPINVALVTEKAKAAKASKAAATAAVTVAPAVEVATTEPVTVAPAFSATETTKQNPSDKLRDIARKYKAATLIKKAVRAKYDKKRNEDNKERDQTQPSSMTLRTPKKK